MFIPMWIIWCALSIMAALALTLLLLFFKPELSFWEKSTQAFSISEALTICPLAEGLLKHLSKLELIRMRCLRRRDLKEYASTYSADHVHHGYTVESIDTKIFVISSDGNYRMLSFDELELEPNCRGNKRKEYYDGTLINVDRTGPDVGSFLSGVDLLQMDDIRFVAIYRSCYRHYIFSLPSHSLELLSLPDPRETKRMTRRFSAPRALESVA